MFAGKFHQARRNVLAGPLIVLLLVAPLAHTQEAVQPPFVSAAVTITNPPPKTVSTALPGVPIPSPTKRRAGFLAGAGLAILSLLALAAGLALVRTFKR